MFDHELQSYTDPGPTPQDWDIVTDTERAPVSGCNPNIGDREQDVEHVEGVHESKASDYEHSVGGGVVWEHEKQDSLGARKGG